MKRRNFSGLLTILLLFAAFVPTGFAESANTNESAKANAPVLAEDERLPFMQEEQILDTREPSTGSLMVKTLGAMLLIVGLIFAVAWAVKKLGFGGNNSTGSTADVELTMITSLSVDKGRTISMLRFGSRILLVGSTTQSFTLLAEETNDGFSHLQGSRSVAELLAEENADFGNEFEQARERLNLWEDAGERI